MLLSMSHDKHILLVTGSSGAGKDTIILELLKQFSSLKRTVGVTTRWPARDGEIFGDAYFFIDQTRFEWLRQTSQMAEYTDIYHHSYGLLSNELDRAWAAKFTPIQVIDFHGLESIRAQDYKVRAVYIDFPTVDEQRRRLISREPDISQIELDERLSHAASERAKANQLEQSGELKIVVNDHIGAATKDAARALGLC